jgi:menaquinone-dependent protoporphyrinogen IX oxidase
MIAFIRDDTSAVMNVLIVYGTVEGQTRKIAEWTATSIRDREHYVDLRDSAEPMSDLELGLFHSSPHRFISSTIKRPLRTSPSRITNC